LSVGDGRREREKVALFRETRKGKIGRNALARVLSSLRCFESALHTSLARSVDTASLSDFGQIFEVAFPLDALRVGESSRTKTTRRSGEWKEEEEEAARNDAVDFFRPIRGKLRATHRTR
jgi:hypothetical protein